MEQKSGIDYLKRLLEQETLINPEKNTFVINHSLTELLEQHGLGNLVNAFMNDPKLRQHIFNGVTNNKTSFFRTSRQFDFLAEYLKQKEGEITIWSAACCTGQESYSIAMIAESLGKDFTVYATDINTDYLEKASQGHYDEQEMAACPLDKIHLMVRFVDFKGNIKEPIRSKVKFSQLNLGDIAKNDVVLPYKPSRFDVIFLKNSLIYMDTSNQKRLVDEIAGHCLNEDGRLFVEVSEGLIYLTDSVIPTGECEGVYKKAPDHIPGRSLA